MSQVVLGIDVSKETLDVALLQEADLKHGKFLNTKEGFARLLRWLHKAGAEDLHACLEATGQYSDAVAEYLYTHAYRVSVVNPARIKAYASSKLRRFKSDKGDAEIIALYCQKEEPESWTPPPASFRELQQMVRYLDDLKKELQQQKNRLEAGGTSLRVQAYLKVQIADTSMLVKQITQDIQNHINQHPDLKAQRDLLKSIPGIGDITAAALLGEVRDLRAFESARQLAAYAGLVPEQRTSGTSLHKKPRLVKRGNAHLRTALYMPAITARKHNPLMQELSKRMELTHHCPMAIIGAIMRKLLHLAYGVIKTGKPFNPEHGKAFAY